MDHQQRRYTDTCLYMTPPSPIYSKNRLSCTLPSSSSSNHHARPLSLDGSIPLIQKHATNRRHSMVLHQSFTKVDSSIDVTQSTKSGQQHAMTSSTHTPPTTTVIKPTPPAITHTSIDLTQQVSSKAIRIERDYSKGDGITKFCTDLPVSLEGKITSDEFKHTITSINTMLESAERLSWSGVFYNMMEILTIYLWPIFFSSHYHKTIHKLLAFIDQENNQVYQKQRLSICNPVKTAFLFIEIQVFD